MSEKMMVYYYRVCVDETGAKILASSRQIREQNLVPLSKGGMTAVQIVDTETEEVLAEGEALCRETEDFNKRLGRTIAYGRAVLPQEERLRRAVPVEERLGLTVVVLSGTGGVKK